MNTQKLMDYIEHGEPRCQPEEPRGEAQEPTLPDLVAHLKRQIAWSTQTFGPGERTEGILDHLRRELNEIAVCPDLGEWIDVVILALDGAWRCGFSATEITSALVAKQEINESREWPDWRTAEPGKAIEHVKPEQLAAPEEETQ